MVEKINVCKYNKFVTCEKEQCATCGFDPTVHAQRVRQIRNVRKKQVLLPCPFCGGEATYHKFANVDMNENVFVKGCGVHCKKCKASTAHCDTKAEALGLWNRRK